MRDLNRGERLTGRRAQARRRYADYMASVAWRKRREAWLEEHRAREGREPVCGICDRAWDLKHDDLHHHDYARLGAEAHEDLAPLCRADHELLHRTIRRSRAWRAHAHSAASRALLQRLRQARLES